MVSQLRLPLHLLVLASVRQTQEDHRFPPLSNVCPSWIFSSSEISVNRTLLNVGVSFYPGPEWGGKQQLTCERIQFSPLWSSTWLLALLLLSYQFYLIVNVFLLVRRQQSIHVAVKPRMCRRASNRVLPSSSNGRPNESTCCFFIDNRSCCPSFAND
jgi:hypothetical protein